MASTPAGPARVPSPFGDARELSEFFAPQRTGSDALPEPEPFLHNLTRGVLEVLAGVREVDQLARWLTEDAYRKLVTRANLATRARSARGAPASRPTHAILSVHHSSPADHVVEAVVIVAGPARTRAVAIRLEGMDRRWRATSLALL
ncbi:Rv3235 family protein [uncultured Microbacterium sp.]|uniref:Rv3235 family protein n=1 Tax=uncultured Microbacterium sp. TaxID=191216 RepID=UPI0035CA6F8F